MPIAPDDIGAAFRRLGVNRGDVLMLHSDAMVLAQLPRMSREQCYDVLFDQLAQVLGPEGTLVLPTFTYSATKDEVFDPAQTPSTVGALTEHFRTLVGVRRSLHPIFSVAARGALAEEFANSDTADCFGPGSAFGLLDRHQAWIACLGCPLSMVTHIHFVEQSRGVPYRYFKTFAARIRRPDGLTQASVRYYVRDLSRATGTNLSRLAQRMLSAQSLQQTPVGRVPLIATRAAAFAAAACALVDEDVDGLIEAGSHG